MRFFFGEFYYFFTVIILYFGRLFCQLRKWNEKEDESMIRTQYNRKNLKRS